MPRILLHLRYNGAPFYGWQSQIPEQPTVQHIVQLWLNRLYNASLTLVGASRTDRGVHARHQLATVDIPDNRYSFATLIYKLNSLLHPNIHILRIQAVPSDFQLHRAVTSKVYTYLLCDRAHLLPFVADRTYVVPTNWTHPHLLNPILKQLEGSHDFVHFANTGSTVKTTKRTLYCASARRWGPVTLLRFHGNGFLKQMVRNMVGAILYVCQNSLPPETIKTWLNAEKRHQAITPAPAHALYLMRIARHAAKKSAPALPHLGRSTQRTP